MKENNKVTNFKETEEEMKMEEQFDDYNKEDDSFDSGWTWRDSLHMFKLQHGDKIKKAAIAVGTVAAVAAGYLLVTALRSVTDEDIQALDELESNPFDSAGETIENGIDSVLDSVGDTTDF